MDEHTGGHQGHCSLVSVSYLSFWGAHRVACKRAGRSGGDRHTGEVGMPTVNSYLQFVCQLMVRGGGMDIAVLKKWTLEAW